MEGKKHKCKRKEEAVLMMQMLGKGATNVTKKRVSLTSGH